MEGKISFLRKLPFFSNTPLETIRLYAYLCKKERYYAGEPVVLQGEPADRMFLIIQGKVAICQDHQKGKFHLQMLTEEGIDYFGELALLSDFEWFFSARAMTDVTLLSITREAFRKVMEKFPEGYAETIGRIVRLRIKSFLDQTEYLLDNIKEDAWRECGTERKKQ